MIRLETDKLPPSLNNAYITGPGGRRFLSPDARAWKSGLGWQFAATRTKGIRGPYAVTIEVPRAMRGDLDNRCKLILDALVDAGATDDDRHLQELTIRRADIRGAVITVEAVDA